jgi:hypothetical protein
VVKKLVVGGVVGTLLLGAAVQVVAPRYAREYESSCWASSLSRPRRVHTNSWDRPDVLGAELTGYTAVHWQVTDSKSALRVLTPDECAYQLVLDLQPAHARRLAAEIAAAEALHQRRFTAGKDRLALARRAAAEARAPERSLPWHPRPAIAPDLRRYVPAGGRWESYGGCCPQQGHRDRSLYVNAHTAVAVVEFSFTD